MAAYFPSRVTRTICQGMIIVLALAGCGKQTSKKITSAEVPTEQTSPAVEANQIGSPAAVSKASQDVIADDSPLVTPKALSNATFIGPLADAYNRIDPTSDGWDTEAFGAAATAQLKRLATQLVSDNPDTADLLASDFTSPSIVGVGQLHEAFQDNSVTVKRISSPVKAEDSPIGTPRFKELVDEFKSHFADHPHIKFKLYRVEPNESTVETMAYFHADGETQVDGKLGHKEITGNWKVAWSPNGATPLIQSIEIQELEVVDSSNQGKYLFADCTASVLGNNESYQKQLLRSTDHWRSRLCRDYGLDVVANHGLAIGDVNGDMLEDIYVCQQGGLPNRLFIQQPDGTLKDVSGESGADWLDYSASALLVDLDNDGDKDLAVGHEQNIVLMSNDGTGKFEIGHVLDSRAQTFSLAAADYDNDGDLDIYCCGYNNLTSMVRTGAMGEPIPYHDAQNGGPNMLLQNASKWNFVEVTDKVGLDQNNNRFSFAASWEDYDNDGDVDLYVSNDYGRNNFYRNDNGRFQDIAGELNIEDMSAGMSISWADMNRDGWMDFYVSNMFSAAGNRITYQRQFKTSTSDDMKKQYQRHARGNSLFQSDGKGGFNDISESAGITMGRWAWGSKFCDINNDGWQDIVVNNGFISTQDTGDL